jgi:hypothetical protein
LESLKVLSKGFMAKGMVGRRKRDEVQLFVDHLPFRCCRSHDISIGMKVAG